MSRQDDGHSRLLSRWSRRKALVRQGLEPAERAPSLPTLADVAALTRESDYARLVGPRVDAGVRNVALKKLFTEPHYKLMDGLDTYIDDYGKPDPLPAGLRATSRQAAAQEHEALFHDLCKPEGFAYGSYLTGRLNDKPVAQLREHLARLGLTRDAQALETEDRIAYELAVMRYLIAGDDAAVCNLEQQRRFFRARLQPWVDQLCEAVLAHPRANTWRAVAAFTRALMQVETPGFDLLES